MPSTAARFPDERPLSLFVTDAHTHPQILWRSLEMLRSAGFTVCTIPWFGLPEFPNGGLRCPGLDVTDGSVTRVLPQGTRLDPQLILARLEPLEARRAAFLRYVHAHECAFSVLLRSSQYSGAGFRDSPGHGADPFATMAGLIVHGGAGLRYTSSALGSDREPRTQTLLSQAATELNFALEQASIARPARLLVLAIIRSLRGDCETGGHAIEQVDDLCSFLEYEHRVGSKLVHAELNRIATQHRGKSVVRLPPVYAGWIHSKPQSYRPVSRGKLQKEHCLELVNTAEGRRQLALDVSGSTGAAAHTVRFKDPSLAGVQVTASRENGLGVLDWVFSEAAGTSALRPPAAAMFPHLGQEPCLVETRRWPSAQFEYLAEELHGPRMESLGSGREGLLGYLGRIITPERTGEPGAQRYIEPGVGRTCITDYLRFDGHPEFHEFTTLGIGLTPYSTDGFAMVGPYVDGLTSLRRAVHRHQCARQLEAIGCRTAKVGAIIALPGLETTMPDETKAPAALVVRGFRSVFRVKQLDPCAGLLLSSQHRPLLMAWLLDPEEIDPSRAILLGPGSTGNMDGTTQNLRRILGATSQQPGAGVEETLEQILVRRRREITRQYAPLLLAEVKHRLALELGRDPECEPVSDGEYVLWFARMLGTQLGRMKRGRFLHDYHQLGVSRYTPAGIYTLCETNVSLMAEFPDLDTALFVEDCSPELLDELLISEAERTHLCDHFERFHGKDLEEALLVTGSLAAVALQHDMRMQRKALREFMSAYEQAGTHIASYPAASLWSESAPAAQSVVAL